MFKRTVTTVIKALSSCIIWFRK